MGLIVQKFGRPLVRNKRASVSVAAKTVTYTYKAGNGVIVVVSDRADNG